MHQHSPGQMKLKESNASSTAGTLNVANVACHLWLPFLINRVLNLRKLKNII